MNKYQSVRCACGNVLDRRNIRASGLAVCRCGNNFTESQFRRAESDNEYFFDATGRAPGTYDAGGGATVIVLEI
ncbi:MAG TPA: hypothetical protein VMX74_01170 [Pirellulales bacterium]|nr:hypothetical protein [Pirellulales bacterium]